MRLEIDIVDLRGRSCPAVLTTEHSMSCYGEPVLLIAGDPYSAREAPIVIRHDMGVEVVQGEAVEVLREAPEIADMIDRWCDAVSAGGTYLSGQYHPRVVAALRAARVRLPEWRP
uniref:Uncharacterized protein n=1 Tax=viral metagenome TaxID=1070528 RepID=A0A6M3JN91_9ZZZZ